MGSELLAEPLEVDSFSPSASSPLKGVAKERSTDKGPTADSSCVREVEKSTTANQRIKSEDAEKDEQTGSKVCGKKKAKVNPSSNSNRLKELKKCTRIKLGMIPKTNVSNSVRRMANQLA